MCSALALARKPAKLSGEVYNGFHAFSTSFCEPSRRASKTPNIATLLAMKALVISRLGGPEVLEIQEVPVPQPAPGQDLVRVDAGGLNFADVMTLSGGYPGAPKPPLVAGREFCGVRESDGQRVMGYTQWSAFAERLAAQSALLWSVPK